MSSLPHRRWRVHLESIAAGMLVGGAVAGLIALAVRLGWLTHAPATGWVMVATSSLAGVIAAAQYLKRHGIDS